MGFLAAGFSSVPSISAFGFFAAFTVLFDYGLCITLFASAVVIYNRHFEQKMGGHMCSNCSCCIIPNKICSCEKEIKFPCCTLEGMRMRYLIPTVATTLLFLFGFVACIAGIMKGLIGVLLICLSLVVVQGVANSKLDKEDGAMTKMRPIEAFFDGPFFRFVVKWKKLLVGIWIFLFLTFSIITGVMLRPPKEQGDFISKHIPVQRWLTALATEFSSGGGDMPVYYVWGIDPDESLDRSGVDYQEPGPNFVEQYGAVALGKPNYIASTYKLFAEAQRQQDMYDMCKQLRADEKLVANSGLWCHQDEEKLENYKCGVRLPPHHCASGVYCFMDQVKDYLDVYTKSSSTQRFPTPDLHGLLASKEFKDYMKHVEVVREKNGYGYLNALYKINTGYEYPSSGKMVYWIALNSTMPYASGTVEEKQAQYDRYDAVVTQYKGSFPKMFQTSPFYSWTTTERELVKSVAQAIGVSVVFCGVVLILMTANVLLGLLGLFSVIVITITTCGLMAACGWSMGIVETICIIVVIGVSVDYSVHLAHAFNHAAPGLNREEKVRHAMSSMGISLLGGLATTIGSSLFLTFADVTFFKSFGIFLVVTVVVSITVAMTFLMPLLAFIGPEGSFCSIPMPKFLTGGGGQNQVTDK
jgi:hypothetical protein